MKIIACVRQGLWASGKLHSRAGTTLQSQATACWTRASPSLSQTALLEADQGQGLSRIAFPHHPNDPQGAKGPSIPSSELEQPSTLQPTLVPTTSASRPARQHASYHTEVTADIRNLTPRQSVYTGLRLAAAKGTQRDTQQGLHILSAEKETRGQTDSAGCSHRKDCKD